MSLASNIPGRYYFRTGDTITIRAFQRQDSTSADTADEDQSQDDDDRPEPPDASTREARSRSPRREVAGASPNLLHSREQHSLDPANDAVWNLRLPDEMVLTSHPFKNTPGPRCQCQALPTFHSNAEALQNLVWRLDCQLQSCTVEHTQAPIVYDISGHALFPDLVHAPFEAQIESDDDDDSIAEQDEWRVTVCVMRYQRTDAYAVLWVARNEDVADFLARAGIILQPCGGPATITLLTLLPFVVSSQLWLLPSGGKKLAVQPVLPSGP